MPSAILTDILSMQSNEPKDNRVCNNYKMSGQETFFCV